MRDRHSSGAKDLEPRDRRAGRVAGPASGRRPAPDAASGGLGWGEGLAVERYDRLGPHRVTAPPEPLHRMTVRLGPPAHDPAAAARRAWCGREAGGALAPGAVTLAPAGSAQRWDLAGPTASLHVLLVPDLVSRAAAAAGLPAWASRLAPCLGRDDGRAARLAWCLAEAMAARDRPAAAAALAAALCVHLACRDLPARGAGPVGLSPRQVRALEAYLRAHLAEPLTVGAMAGVVGLSATHFCRQFKAAVGVTPHAYHVRLRVRRAADLLRAHPERRAAAVAAEVGFSDQSHLVRHCKRVLGATPSQLRAAGRDVTVAVAAAAVAPAAGRAEEGAVPKARR